MTDGIRKNGRLVVIGGDAAGMSAASRARRMRPDLDIVVLERGYDVSYSACSLPYYVEGLVDHRDDLVVISADEFRSERHIDVRLGSPAVAIDAAGRRVVYGTIEDETTREIPYDALVIATGASAIKPDVPGAGLAGVFALRTIVDADAVKLRLKQPGIKRATVVGAGYIGLEMVTSLRALGLDVTLIEMAPRILTTYDESMAAVVRKELEEQGVDVRTGSAVEAFEGTDGVEATIVGGERVPTDIAVVGAGVRPNVAIAETAGVALGSHGAIAVDRHQRTNVDGIYAAGDCAEDYNVVTGKQDWVPLAQNANKQGRVAGANAAGSGELFGGTAATNVSKIFRLEVAGTGLSEEAAREHGFECGAVSITSRSRAELYPGTKPLRVRLVFEHGSGRVLGGQIVAEEGAAKRIDSIATAIFAGMTVEQLAVVDMSYAPPFSPVWDPVLIAASQAAKKVSARSV